MLAGAVVANPDSPLAAAFEAWLASEDPAVPGDDDAAELAANSRVFLDRMVAVNRNGEALAALLRSHEQVERVCYPENHLAHPYALVARPGAGTGGLISFTLRGGEPAAERFYDALQIDKGPSLGADFSLICPYTLLAHYDELEHARAWGVPRDLLRISVGTERTADLLAIVNDALAFAAE